MMKRLVLSTPLLNRLNLQGCAGLEELVLNSENTPLEYLLMSSCHDIAESGLRDFLSRIDTRTLKTLNLISMMQISDATVYFVMDRFENLSSTDLSGCKRISDVAKIHFNACL
jgi:hypothetical protein